MGNLKTRVRTGPRIGRVFEASCHVGCKTLKIYAPRAGDKRDDLYEVGGVCATRNEFKELFRRAGF